MTTVFSLKSDERDLKRSSPSDRANSVITRAHPLRWFAGNPAGSCNRYGAKPGDKRSRALLLFGADLIIEHLAAEQLFRAHLEKRQSLETQVDCVPGIACARLTTPEQQDNRDRRGA